MAGCCDRSNEPSGSVKCGEFVDKLRNSSVFKDFVSWN